MVGGKHEADACLRDALGNGLGCKVEVGAKGFNYVGTAAFAADAASAVFADFCTCCCYDEHAAGRDVEGVCAVAACAYDIDQMLLVCDGHFGGKFAHDLRGGGDFADGFFLDAQPRGDGCKHDGGEFAAHDLAHKVEHFVVEDFAVLDGALQGFLGGDLDGVGHGFLAWGGWRKYGYERKMRKNYAKVAEKYQSQWLKICCIAFATFA